MSDNNIVQLYPATETLVSDEEVAEAVTRLMPSVRHRLLTCISAFKSLPRPLQGEVLAELNKQP
jgi:hypothetical protein